jgi:hypothetical protein
MKLKVFSFLLIFAINIFYLSCKENPTESTPDINSVNLKMEFLNGNYVLSWQSLSNTTDIHYNIYRRDNETSNWTKLGTIAGNAWNDTTLLNYNGMYNFEYSITYGNKNINESNHSLPVPISILNDNFNDNVNRLYDSNDPEDDSCIVTNGELKIPSIIGRNRWLSFGLDNWKDVTIEVDAKSEADSLIGTEPAYGVAFRFTYADSIFNFYEFFIFHNSVVQLSQYKTDDWTNFGQNQKRYNIYSWNKTRLEIKESMLNAYVNNGLVLVQTIENLKNGKMGLTSQSGVSTYFDNLKVLVTGYSKETDSISKIISGKSGLIKANQLNKNK